MSTIGLSQLFERWKETTEIKEDISKKMQEMACADEVAFLESEYGWYDPETQEPIVLQSWERLLLRYIFASNKTRRVMGDIKKNFKTCKGAMVLYVNAWKKRCIQYIVGNDQKQSENRAFDYIKNVVGRGIEGPGMNPYCKDVIVKRGEMIFPNGSKIIAVAQDPKGEAGSNSFCVLFDETWGMCHKLNKISVLTRNGWRSAKDISFMDEVATRDEKGFLQWQHPTNIFISDYKGEMHNFTHRRMKFSVTPNHRVYGRFFKSGMHRSDFINGRVDVPDSYVFAKDADKWYGGIVATTCKWKGVDMEHIYIGGVKYDAVKMFKLIGWYIAEGYNIWGTSRKNKRYSLGFGIAQYDTSAHYDEIEQLLKSLDLNYKKWKKQFTIKNKRLGQWFARLGKSHNKYIPVELKNASPRLLDALLAAYLKGDGWKTDGDGWQFYTVSKRLADDLLEVGLKCGWIPKMMPSSKSRLDYKLPEHMKQSWNPHLHKECYRGSFSRQHVSWERFHKHWSTDHYEGKIWCLTVPNSNFYVREGGHCFWTGNSSDKAQRVMEEFTVPATQPDGFQLFTSYAGFEDDLVNGVEPFWRRMYLEVFDEDQNLRESTKIKCLDPGNVIWSNDDYRTTEFPLYETKTMLMYWSHGPLNNHPGQNGHTEKYFEDQRQSLRIRQFLRMHENRWVTNTEESVLEKPWRVAVSQSVVKEKGSNRFVPYRVPLPEMLPRDMGLFVGVDGSTKNDHAAIASVYPHPELDGKLAIGPWKVWRPNPKKREPVDLSEMEKYLYQLNEKCYVRKIIYDPSQLHHMMTNMSKVLGDHRVIEFSQSQKNLIKASENLLTLIKSLNLLVPDDETLLWYVQNAVADEGKEGWKIRKPEGKQKRKVDWTVAFSFACLFAVDELHLFSGERTDESPADQARREYLENQERRFAASVGSDKTGRSIYQGGVDDFGGMEWSDILTGWENEAYGGTENDMGY